MPGTQILEPRRATHGYVPVLFRLAICYGNGAWQARIRQLASGRYGRSQIVLSHGGLYIGVFIETMVQALPGLEVQCNFGWHPDPISGARIATDPGRTPSHIEAAEPSQLDPLASRQGHGNLMENRVDDAHDVTQLKIRMGGRKTLDQFRFVHA